MIERHPNWRYILNITMSNSNGITGDVNKIGILKIHFTNE